MCGLELEIEGGQIVAIRGDDNDAFSRGHLCPKGPAMKGLHEDPERLQRPLRKTPSGDFETVDWDEALDEAANRIHAIQSRHGKDAVGTYLGNPNVHNMGTMLYGPQMLRTLGTRNRFSATSVDQLPHHLIGHLMWGHQLLLPIPDIDHTEHMLIVGGNPLVSNGSIMSVPDVRHRLRAIQGRGGKLVVIDPRKTETAHLADEHVFVRPGTDALLLASMLRVLFDEGLGRTPSLGDLAVGEAEVRRAVEPFSPEAVEGPTGVPAATIRSLVREFAAADRAVAYGRLGVSTQSFGSLCQWFLVLLNYFTGNLDRRGGAMFTEPAFDIVAGPRALGAGPGRMGRYKSRVRGLPEFGGELPSATMAEEILEPGEGQIRALLTSAGNPVLSTPNGAQLDRALEGLEFMVSIDFYVNETTRHADLILPPTGPLEHGHYDVAFHALAVRNTAKYSPPIFEPGPHQRHDWEILVGLEARIARLRGAPLHERMSIEARRRLEPEGILEIGFRAGPWGFGGGLSQGVHGLGMRRLRASPHGVDLGPLRPSLRRRMPGSRAHPGKIDLAPELLVADLTRLAARIDQESPSLVLIGRRHLRSNNSWMHNVPKLMTGKPRCTLKMHPTDAEVRGLEDGQEVTVRSRVGEVVVALDVDADLMPGVVSLPHGWGHGKKGIRQSVAAAHPGVSVNDLVDEMEVDRVSGNAVTNGVPVEVEGVAAAAE